jgi:Bacterial archaeo-eukaryotic release factor family 10
MITADTVNSILNFHGNGLPVVSLYARVDPGARRRELHTRVSSLLDEIRPVAKDAAVDREGRLSLRADLARIRNAISEEQWRPGAVAVFSCSGRGWYEEVQLPQPVSDRVVVDATPHTHPVVTVLEEHERCCVAVVDRAYARFWELYQDEVRELDRVRDRELRKPNYAAWFAEYHVRNKAEELSKQHYRHVAGILGQMLQAGGFDVLAIGGHDYEVPEFLQQLPRDLQLRVAGTFCVDLGTASLPGIRSAAGAIVMRHEREHDRQLVAEVLEKVATGGLATLGLRNCLWAGSAEAIQTLLVREGTTAPGVVCDESGWLAVSGDVCPVCGKPTRRTPDVVDELVQVVISRSGSVHHVDADTRQDFVMGAELRFPLPEPPMASSAEVQEAVRE